MSARIFRQGEVLLEEISEIPVGLKEKNKILAYGEVTGHHHRFECEGVQVFADEKQEQFVVVTAVEAELKHEEHKPIKVPKGAYRVRIQREFDAVLAATQQVRD